MSATVSDTTGIDAPTSDPDAIGEFWSAIVADGDVHEVRIPKSRRGPLRLYRTVSGYFDNRDDFMSALTPISGADAEAVYLTLNPVNVALLARAANRLKSDARSTTSDADIIRLAHLLIDVDPVRPSDISATDAERDQAIRVRTLIRRWLRDEHAWPDPVASSMSGNGGGLIYRIDLPNEPDDVALLQCVLQGLDTLFSTEQVKIDTTNYNAARITKIVGTVAAKGDHVLVRPWRLATGRFNPSPATVSRELLAAVAAFAPKHEPRSSPNGYVIVNGRTWDIRDVLRRNGIGFTAKDMGYAIAFALDRCLTSQDHTAGACVLEFPSGALSYTCRHDRCQGKRWEDVRGALGVPTDTGPTTTMNGKIPGPHNAAAEAAADSREHKDRETWPTLDPAALHGLAGDVVRAFSPFTESDDAAVLMTFLTLFGAACNRTPHTYAGEDRHGVNLFVCVVGDTSKSRKGSSLGPARRIMERADAEFVRARIQGGLNSGEGLIWAIRDQITKVNKKGETEVVDEGIADKRLVCIEEEFSSVLKVMQRQGNTVSETMRRAWDARRQLASMTKNSPAVATNHHVALVAHITGDEVTRTLTETEMANGLGNRFLWHAARRSKVLPNPGRLSEERAADLGRRVGEALTFARQGGEFVRDDEAAAIWNGVYANLSDGKPGLAGALMARGEAQVVRLSLIYALLDKSRTIGTRHMMAALAVWQHCEASIRYVFGDATGDPIADRILTALRRQGPIDQTDISVLFGRHVAAARIGQALETLAAAGRAKFTKEATPGRSRIVWQAVP